MNEDGSPRRLIKFDNHVSIGHVITTICIIFSGVWYVAENNNRIGNLERQDTVFKEQLKDMQANYREDFREIKQSLFRIEAKLDQKADKPR